MYRPSWFTKVQIEPRAGFRLQMTSQNFCDKTTWYTKSTRHTGEVLQKIDEDGYVLGLTFPVCMVDTSHGKIFGEHKIADGYGAKVYIDGYATAHEKNPDTGLGDYEINYRTGEVTFTQAQAGVISMDYSEVTTSEWYLRAATGKIIKVISAEVQFSTDSRMQDSFSFQARARVGQCPLLNPYWNQNPAGAPGPYPTGTLLPIAEQVIYKTVMDLVIESTGSCPVIPKTTTDSPTWRDLPHDVQVFRWTFDAQGTLDIVSSWGTEVEIKLLNNTECSGTAAVVTFYGLIEDEPVE